ncbi:MAG TPA: hypothetical protein PL129_08645 [bacterium]|nr:hypothetical protein [bacterium]
MYRWLFLLVWCAPMAAFTQAFVPATRMPKTWINTLSLSSGFEYNTWSPYKADELRYTIEGFQIGYLRGEIDHNVPMLPNLNFSWETNFGGKKQNELMQAQNSTSKLEQGYEKLHTALEFGKKKIYNDAGQVINTMANWELTYTKETFYIAVSPKSSDLKYAAYYSDAVYNFPQGAKYSMFTKFQEIGLTAYTGGESYFMMIFTGLFGGGSGSVQKLGKDTETRFGFYYATFQKPYMVSQVLSGGTNNGESATVYNTRFKSYGIKEEIKFDGKGGYFNFTQKLGLVTVNLRKGTELEDSESPLFFHYAIGLEGGLRIQMDRFHVLLGASGEYGFMLGGTYNEEEENDTTGEEGKIKTTSFINNDLLIKYRGVIQYYF